MMGYGDMNLNGISFETADHQLLGRVLLGDVGAWDANPAYRQAQLETSDVNMDQIPATIADLQYLARNITGDAKEFPGLNTKSKLAKAKLSRKKDVIAVASENEVGSVCLAFKGQIADDRFINLSPLDMEVFSSDSLTTVLLYCRSSASEMTRKLARGKNQLLRVDKKAKLLRAETSDYDGNLLQTSY